MSHFTVLVIGDNIEEQLNMYDENLEVPHIKSKEDLINEIKEEIKRYKNNEYQNYLKNPEKYIENTNNPQHIEYIQVTFPQKLKWTDEECYQEAIKYYDSEEINEDGSVNQTYNPNSKYDYYVIGGRWSGQFLLKEGVNIKERGYKNTEGDWGMNKESLLKLSGRYDSLLFKDIDFEKMKTEKVERYEKKWNEIQNNFNNGKITEKQLKELYNIESFNESEKEKYLESNSVFSTFAVVKEGKWYESGEMGWFGISLNDKENWSEIFQELLSDVSPDTRLTVLDCHI